MPGKEIEPSWRRSSEQRGRKTIIGPHSLSAAVDMAGASVRAAKMEL